MHLVPTQQFSSKRKHCCTVLSDFLFVLNKPAYFSVKSSSRSCRLFSFMFTFVLANLAECSEHLFPKNKHQTRVQCANFNALLKLFYFQGRDHGTEENEACQKYTCLHSNTLVYIYIGLYKIRFNPLLFIANFFSIWLK